MRRSTVLPETETAPSAPRDSTETGPAISAAGLTKDYGDVRALDSLDLEVPRGSVFGLIGPNGAGKTTTFGLLCGWLRPTSGSLEVLGGPPGGPGRLKGRIAALPQDASFPRGVPVGRSLVHYSRLQGMDDPAARREAARVLEIVGMERWADARPEALSHGMAKRVALAQALLGSPELILLDEPTAGLDPGHAHRMRELVHGLRGRATVVVSSHNLHELESLCDAAAILREGRLAASGTMTELTASDREVLVELANPVQEAEALGGALREAGVVADATVEEREMGTVRLIVRLPTEAARQPHAAVSAVLGVLLEHGALVGQVERGRGLEETVLSLE